jgi:hypothetical protein
MLSVGQHTRTHTQTYMRSASYLCVQAAHDGSCIFSLYPSFHLVNAGLTRFQEIQVLRTLDKLGHSFIHCVYTGCHML